MILNIYAHKNTKIECFTQPIYSDVDPDKFAINEKRSLMAAENLAQIVPFKNLVLYYIGVFDDETGEIVTVDEDGNKLLRKLYDCSVDVLKRIADEKGVTEDEIESVPTSR